MSELSLHRRLVNAIGSQQVENVKAQHAYLHARADATGEWGKYWSTSPETSWAHAFGRMRGFEQVWYGSVTRYDAQAFEHWLSVYEKYPEVGGKDPRTILEASIHTLVTDVIEVAEDGQSARGSFITPGLITSRFNADGHPYCMILWERYGSDFVCEDGEWKYLHEHVCPDLFGEHDCTNWARMEYDRACEEEDPAILDGVRIPFERTSALNKWTVVGEVLVPGVFSVGDIDKTDGIAQAAALADKF